jgi:hypothetical protein
MNSQALIGTESHLIPISFTSRLITKITTLRNPLGKESNWLYARRFNPKHPSYFVLSCSYVAYLATCIFAVIETLISAITKQNFKPFFSINSKSYLEVRLASSFFSIIWSVGLLISNHRFSNLCTSESSARKCDINTFKYLG